jgi:hypothetical protein
MEKYNARLMDTKNHYSLRYSGSWYQKWDLSDGFFQMELEAVAWFHLQGLLKLTRAAVAFIEGDFPINLGLGHTC